MNWRLHKHFTAIAIVLSAATAPSFLSAESDSDLFVSALAVSPSNPSTIYAVTTYSIGVLKSTDGGDHWQLINQGIKSYSLYDFAVHPVQSETLYLGAGGGGLYVSEDGGAQWVERNAGLQNTDIGQMRLHPDDPERIYIVTSTGVHATPDAGVHWRAWNEGDHFTTSQEFQNLAILPGEKTQFFLASKQGLYTRREEDPSWESASKDLEGKLISALAVDPSGKAVWAAALRDGKTLKGGGLFVSHDRGRHWEKVGKGLDREWIRVIRLDPNRPERIYLATSGRGVLKSSDGGHTWKESNQGMKAADIRALVLDPSNPRTLYAGAHGEGIFKSTDGGSQWRHLNRVPAFDLDQIMSQLRTADPSRPKPTLRPPPEFAKCNRCHGWTDPYINMLPHGFWLVPPNRRDWSVTVKRMMKGTEITAAEQARITDFLQAYSERYGGP